MEAGGSGIQGHSQLHSKIEASLGYTKLSQSKNNINKNKIKMSKNKIKKAKRGKEIPAISRGSNPLCWNLNATKCERERERAS